MSPGAEDRFRYLFESPQDRAGFDGWLARAAASEDPMFFAVIDLSSQRCEGRQALMRITPEHGVIEVGSILWGPAIARTRIATEALYLSARYAFGELGYRRFEWKCNARNEPSMRAAVIFEVAIEITSQPHEPSEMHWCSFTITGADCLSWRAIRHQLSWLRELRSANAEIVQFGSRLKQSRADL